MNLGLGGLNPAGWQSLLDNVPAACKAIGPDRLDAWEYGNEPDLFYLTEPRPGEWNEPEYVRGWLNGTRQIKSLIEEHCPDMTGPEHYGYFAPSFSDNDHSMDSPIARCHGLNEDENIKFYARHGYVLPLPYDTYNRGPRRVPNRIS